MTSEPSKPAKMTGTTTAAAASARLAESPTAGRMTAPPLEPKLHFSVTIAGPSNRPGGTDVGGDPLDLLQDHRRTSRAEAQELRARARAAALSVRQRRPLPQPSAVQ